ncbi:MAG: hypothetical protein ABIW46_03465 [Acidimicrobiales bacterium]
MTFCEVEGPALVLGSTQPSAHVEDVVAAALGVEVVRRRSGGGAVLVEPGRMLWVDVVVPAGDDLWQADVGRAFWWLGEVWARALISLGAAGARVHRGPLLSSRWSPMVCFAGLGPGEVCAGGGKVVGISQRRVREGALFQCAVPLAWDPAAIAALLSLDAASRTALETDGAAFVGRLPDCSAARIEESFLSQLPGRFSSTRRVPAT